MICIDEPRWPAHGTHFAHLVSDASHAELLDFADAAALHPRAFDHDHYDVPAARHEALVALGAVRMASTDLVRRLRASGLRVAQADRTPKRRLVVGRLRAAWDALAPAGQDAGVRWTALGDDLLARWSAPGRHYHDVRHLAQVLDALDMLAPSGASGTRGVHRRTLRLAAWFHDAVYAGRPGLDEEASAELAEQTLTGVVPDAEVREVARLVRLTASHDPEPSDAAGAALVDADLSILGQVPGRYLVYARDVRLEHALLRDDEFRTGRLGVLDALLAREHLFSTPLARTLWQTPAAQNMRSERERARRGSNLFNLDRIVSP